MPSLPWPRSSGAGAHGRRRERGAVLVETAIVVLLLLVSVAATIEYGALFGSTIDVSAAAASAARTGVASTDRVVGDDQILATITYAKGGQRSGVKRVIIYRATPGNTGPPSPCLDSYPPPVGQKCNVYQQADLTLDAASLAALPGANGWPPAERAAGVDYLGVWVEMERTRLTGLVWSPTHFSDNFVMQIEQLSTAGSAESGSSFAEWNSGTTKNPGWSAGWIACPSTGCTYSSSPPDTTPSGGGGGST